MAAKRLLFAFLSMLCFASVAPAHPYHVSVAEIERDAETNRLEVALRVWPEDLERALGRSIGEKVDLERTENIDELVASYLESNILVAPPGEKPADAYEPEPIPGPADENGERGVLPRLIWVGKEIDAGEAWLYFELRLPEGVESLEGVWISSRVLIGTVERQENVMQVRDGSLRVTVRTDERALWARIEAPAGEPSR